MEMKNIWPNIEKGVILSKQKIGASMKMGNGFRNPPFLGIVDSLAKLQPKVGILDEGEFRF